jgi:uncharacterized protein (DUF433 family)
MAILDWSQCADVESIFENLEDGITIDEVIEQFPVSREQVRAVLEFATASGRLAL